MLKAAAFVTSSRDAWMKKRHKVVELCQKVGFIISVESSKLQHV